MATYEFRVQELLRMAEEQSAHYAIAAVQMHNQPQLPTASDNPLSMDPSVGRRLRQSDQESKE